MIEYCLDVIAITPNLFLVQRRILGATEAVQCLKLASHSLQAEKPYEIVRPH